MTNLRPFLTRHHWRFWFGVVAFLYGVVAVYRLASGAIAPPVAGKIEFEAVVHVMLWTFAPPLWFAYESTYLRPSESWEQFKYNQELAGKLWAAVLAAILFLLKP